MLSSPLPSQLINTGPHGAISSHRVLLVKYYTKQFHDSVCLSCGEVGGVVSREVGTGIAAIEMFLFSSNPFSSFPFVWFR